MKFSIPKSKALVPASGKSLVAASRAKLTVFRFTPEAVALRDTALEAAKSIVQVTTDAEQEIAVEAQMKIAEIKTMAEVAWEAAKRPLIDYRKKMDDCAKQFISGLETEGVRLSRAVGDFHSLALARQRAAEQAENERLSQLERERAAELAAATSIEEVENVQEQYNERARLEALHAASQVQPMGPAKVEGQQIREDWVFEVSDIWLLARAHPGCVRIEPRASEIKNLLNNGVNIAGVRAWREVKGTVRVGKAINV